MNPSGAIDNLPCDDSGRLTRHSTPAPCRKFGCWQSRTIIPHTIVTYAKMTEPAGSSSDGNPSSSISPYTDYTREELFEAVREAIVENREPDLLVQDFEAWRTDTHPSASSIRRRLGWDTALERAGESVDIEPFSREECIAAVKEAYEASRGDSFTAATYRDWWTPGSAPSPATIGKHVGWPVATRLVGSSDSPYTTADCVAAVETAAAAVDADYLTHEAYSEWRSQSDSEDVPSLGTIKTVVGWSEAKRKAGLVVRQTGPGYTDEECLRALRQAATETDGTGLSANEYESWAGDDVPSRSTISRQLGWSNAKQQAGIGKADSGGKRTVEDCVEAVQRVAARSDEDNIASDEYDRLADEDDPSASVIQKRVGWNAAKQQAGLPGAEQSGYSDTECIDSIQQAADDIGHENVSSSEYRQWADEAAPSLAYIMDHLGWPEAKRQAGLELNEQYTVEDCLDAIRRAADRADGDGLTRAEYEECKADTDPSAYAIRDRMQWSEAKERAGIDATGSKVEYSAQDCIEAVERAAAKTADETVSISRYREWAGVEDPSPTVIRKRIGWNEAKRKAGVTVTEKSTYTIEDCLTAISRVADRAEGDTVTQREYRDLREDTDPSIAAISSRLPWSKAKERAGVD